VGIDDDDPFALRKLPGEVVACEEGFPRSGGSDYCDVFLGWLQFCVLDLHGATVPGKYEAEGFGAAYLPLGRNIFDKAERLLINLR
jgi:hypothetical protein